jgi:hypothetical protein
MSKEIYQEYENEEDMQNYECGHEELTQEQFQEETYVTSPVELEMSDVEFLDINQNEFAKGINEASYISGYYTALVNSGMSLEFAQNYLLNVLACNMSIEIAKINAQSNVDVSKHQQIVMEKNSL